MSLATLLLAFAPAAIAARFKPEESEALSTLKRELTQARTQIAELEFALVRANERVRELLNERPLETFRAQQAQLAQYQQNQLANFPQGYQQGLAQSQGQLAMQAQLNDYFGEIIDCTGGGRSRHFADLNFPIP